MTVADVTACPAGAVGQLDAPAAGALDERVVPQLEYLRDDEIVQISLKPSRWYILIVPLRDLLLLAVIGLVFWLLSAQASASVAPFAYALLGLVMLCRIAVASLQWASRLYILTNRRVMRFSGIVAVKVAECRLDRIAHTQLKLSSAQQLLRIGSVVMAADESQADAVNWQHIARPAQVYQTLIRAIRKSQNGPTA